MRLLTVRRAAAAAFVFLAAAPAAHAQSSCDTQGACLDAVLAAGRSGRERDETALMHAMQHLQRAEAGTVMHSPTLPPRTAETLGVGDIDAALTQLVGNEDSALGGMPDYHRALALVYLKTGRVDDARRLLEDALAADPTYAPYWLDLAVVYARAGRHERAVSALVVADTWAGDQAALREAYRRAADGTTEPGMGQDYANALQAIAANEAEAARADAGVPPPPPKGTRPDPSRKPAIIDFDTCAHPEYPHASLRYEETGSVTLRFLVGADGSIRRMRKETSSGNPELDSAAAFALSACRFRPATVDGKPVAAWQLVQYVWTLE